MSWSPIVNNYTITKWYLQLYVKSILKRAWMKRKGTESANNSNIVWVRYLFLCWREVSKKNIQYMYDYTPSVPGTESLT